MRRGPDDKEWKKVKEEVKKRDKGLDRMIRICTPVEFVILKRNAGPLLNILDPAHIIAVSENLSGTYLPFNIITLDRWSHTCLDEFKDPITGKNITKEEVNKWWKRLLHGDRKQEEEFNKWIEEEGINWS